MQRTPAFKRPAPRVFAPLWRLGLALWLLVFASSLGCQGEVEPVGLPQILNLGAPQGDASPKASQGGEAKRKADREAKKDLGEALDARRVTSSLDHAGDRLSDNYTDFLAREPQGFKMSELAEGWRRDAATLPARLKTAREKLKRASPLVIASQSSALFVTLLFLILFALLDRNAHHLAYRWHHTYYTPLSALVTRLGRQLILLSARLGTPALLLALSYFPVHALFGPLTWTRMLSATLWVLLIYRFVSGLIELALAFPWTTLNDQHASRLRRVLLLLTTMATIAAELYMLALAFDPAPPRLAFLTLCFELFIALLPIGLISVRHALSHLFAERQSEERIIYLSGLRFAMRHYYAILSLTCALLAMRAFGYVNASTSLLARGYGLVGLLLLGSLALRTTRRFFDTRIKLLERRDQQRELLFSIKRLVTIALGLLLLLSAARILGLYEPLEVLLKMPLLTLQSVQFSLYNLASAAVIVGAALLCSKSLRAVLNARVYPAFGVEIGIAYAVNTIVGYVVIVVGFFLVLIALGVNLSALTVVAASLSVGIGFGLQTLTENLISGFIILFGRTVRKGDYITIHEVYGRVEAVGARSVVVRTPDNYDLLIPSKELVAGSLINWTYQENTARLHIPVGVSYACDPRQVEKVLIETAKSYPRIEPFPAPEAWLVSFGDSSVNFEVLVHYDCTKTIPKRVVGELNYLIWEALKRHHIEIPFPQRDLHLRSADLLPELKAMLEATVGAQRPDREDRGEEE